MKSFLNLVEEKTKAVVLHYGRMNPPTKGHEENINGVKALAKKHNADHVIIASHSHDAKKNPLSPEVKKKHLSRAFPDTNIHVADKENPTLMHHAKKLHQAGYNHLIVAAGADRAKEYHSLLHKYNGPGKEYNFKKITVTSTGERKDGVSGTDMRNHAKSGNYQEFKKNLPSKTQSNEKHSQELYNDTRKGMGVGTNESRGMFKAIFITGGPGSGKDIIIRESIAESKITEISASQAFDFLADKNNLGTANEDYRFKAIQNRGPLVISGPSDNTDRILYIKEELEELGYEAFMVFVNTTDEISKDRNRSLSRVMQEDVRQEKWNLAQENMKYLYDKFDSFMSFNNTVDMKSGDILQIEQKESELTEILDATNWFLDKPQTLIAEEWMIKHNKININEVFEREFNGKKKTIMPPPGTTVKDNSFPKKPQAYGCGIIVPESTNTDIRIGQSPNISRFRTDKESKRKDKSLKVVDRMDGSGVGEILNTRSSGTVWPGAGLGNLTMGENLSFSKFRKYMQEVAVSDPSQEWSMTGAGPTTSAMNSEKPNSISDKYTIDNAKRKIKKRTKS